MEQDFSNLSMGFMAQLRDERIRQIRVEGFTADHDDEHRDGELAQAAACYAMPHKTRTVVEKFILNFWPWLNHWWKPAAVPDRPQSRQRELIKAAALLYAEWDRLERGIIAINEQSGDTLAAAAITEPEDIQPDILPSEAVLGFIAWLTTRQEPVILSASHDASIGVKLYAEYITAQGWADCRPEFPNMIKSMSQPDTDKPNSDNWKL